MTMLEKTRIRRSPLTNKIVLARFGKDPSLALETRDATPEFLMALTEWIFDGKMPEVGKKGELSYGGGDEQFKITIERIPAATVHDPSVCAEPA